MKIGFIGIGNMGGAILKGLLSLRENNEYYVVGRDYEKTLKIAENLGVKAFKDIESLAKVSDIIFIGVKPNKFNEVLPQVARGFDTEKICISMAAGITIESIEKHLGTETKIIRIMPNTPALVGEGMISISPNANIKEDELILVKNLMSALGNAEAVDESLIDAVIGVSGSSPAYTYMYIEALAKNAEENGIDKDSARIFAAQAVLGAAKMVLETDTDLEVLVDNVCSPGGTTIEAVNFLREKGFQKTVSDGAQAAVDKSKKMNG